MKIFTLLSVLILSQAAFAQRLFSSYTIQMTCGEVQKARNGLLLKRLEPHIFGINAKYVLTTKFKNAKGYTATGSDLDGYQELAYTTNNINKAYTYFSLKEKFQQLRDEFKAEIKKAKEQRRSLYACVGHIDVKPLKYMGSQVYYSYESVEDAKAQMREKAEQHL